MECNFSGVVKNAKPSDSRVIKSVKSDKMVKLDPHASLQYTN